MVKIAVNGAAGRMGSRILALAKASGDFDVVGAFDESTGARLSASELKKKGKGVLIDFSSPEGASNAVTQARDAGWGIVVGTTGLDENRQKALAAAAKDVAIVFSANMSVGVHVMLELLELAAKKLPKDFSIDITEAHHIHKKDAPSGTALMLSKAIAAVTGQKIGIKSIREGEIVGEHTVLFEGPAESIEVTHRAKSRDTFVRGALLAAQFVSKKTKGLYTMKDVLAIQP